MKSALNQNAKINSIVHGKGSSCNASKRIGKLELAPKLLLSVPNGP